ncbi:MAG: hypothetical protein BJ554DRAFT_5167 [Olpidium bornovanus]|uniref:Uncharacterized protein n=1 Tax=Olpidium bornovanus TaxID=278681 RepID=A0A8H7ZKQ4_9FUNG|nr:MAG: hypothetical protein BJ554DRAFT_5167 [Olpidium bornovanus]
MLAAGEVAPQKFCQESSAVDKTQPDPPTVTLESTRNPRARALFALTWCGRGHKCYSRQKRPACATDFMSNAARCRYCLAELAPSPPGRRNQFPHPQRRTPGGAKSASPKAPASFSAVMKLLPSMFSSWLMHQSRTGAQS